MTRPAKEKEDGDIYLYLAEKLDPFHVSVSCTYMYYSVADSCPSPLKEGRTHKNCKSKTLDNDILPSKSASAGRGLIDALQGPYNSCRVHRYGKNRCKTCVNIVEGHSFSSNVSGRHYNVKSNQPTMTCETDNVIYLISCGRCGIQYVGETSQMLRKRMNNHRNRLKNTSEMYKTVDICS